MIAIDRTKLGENAGKVTYVIADIFTWQPDRSYDSAVFAFWISHTFPGIGWISS